MTPHGRISAHHSASLKLARLFSGVETPAERHREDGIQTISNGTWEQDWGDRIGSRSYQGGLDVSRSCQMKTTCRLDTGPISRASLLLLGLVAEIREVSQM
jgi:hypothetical protein